MKGKEAKCLSFGLSAIGGAWRTSHWVCVRENTSNPFEFSFGSIARVSRCDFEQGVCISLPYHDQY
jgi:hypothetical protein